MQSRKIRRGAVTGSDIGWCLPGNGGDAVGQERCHTYLFDTIHIDGSSLTATEGLESENAIEVLG
jgi:hypothetical protein